MPPCRMLRLRALKLCVLALMATAMLMTFRTGFSAWTQTNKQKNRVTSVLKHAAKASRTTSAGAQVEPLTMTRDVTWQEKWPEIEANADISNHVYSSVHYVWCGADRAFTFQQYLGVLSAVRVLKPLTFFFHHTDGMPTKDRSDYNTWLKELNSTVPFLEIRSINNAPPCKSKELLLLILDIINREGGGVFLGEDVSLARAPNPDKLDPVAVWFSHPLKEQKESLTFDKRRGLDPKCLAREKQAATLHSESFSVDYSRCLVFVKHSFNADLLDLPHALDSASSGNPTCSTIRTFNDLLGHQGQTQGQGRTRPQCISLHPCQPLLPSDIFEADSPFAELARWLFYGRRAEMHVPQDDSQPIPRITHYVRLQRGSSYDQYHSTFSFNHYLSVMSALYVAGFEHVYMHLDVEPTGRWWEELRGENITLVYLHTTRTVFQQKVLYIKHFSDLARFNIVYRYGGAYQDFDVIWTSRVPDNLLTYPALITRDKAFPNSPWTGGVSIGLFMAKPGAQFIRQYLKTYKTYRGHVPLYNGDKMAHRTWELYPHTIRIDTRLQMICSRRYCYPRWEPPDQQQWDLENDVKGRNHNWTLTHSIHVSIPKNVTSFFSPQLLRDGADMYADIGRNVLRKSGKLHLIEGEKGKEEGGD